MLKCRTYSSDLYTIKLLSICCYICAIPLKRSTLATLPNLGRIFDKCVGGKGKGRSLVLTYRRDLSVIVCVCVCQHFYWILFALQQLRHKSLHHYEFLLPCPIDSHCANLKGARKGKEKREREGERRCVCVSRAFYVFFAYFPSMQAKWIYGNFSNAFGTIMANGAWHIDALTRRPQWKPFRSIASAGSLSLPLPLLLHLLHPSLTDLKLQLAGLLRFPLLPSSAQCKQFSVLLIEMAKWRM